jgi:cyclophilin family peptidyl-prolyl cis-trans isomerase
MLLQLLPSTVFCNNYNVKRNITCAVVRSFSTGSRGSRGRGWFTKYRSGRGGRHLQGPYWDAPSVESRTAWNNAIFNLGSSKAFLEFSTEGWKETKRIELELATAALPKTCYNFLKLCQGYALSDDPHTLGYKNTIVDKIEKTTGICLGDVYLEGGKAGRCHPTVGKHHYSFPDEGFILSHGATPGTLSMLSSGVHKNDSRFLITTSLSNHLDGRFVAFGRVSEGMDVIYDMSRMFSKRGKPANDITLVDCGVLEGYDFSAEELKIKD